MNMFKSIMQELAKALTFIVVTYFLFKMFDLSLITATLLSAIMCSIVFVLLKRRIR